MELQPATSGKAMVDAQVNVYPDPETPEAIRKALEEKRKEVKSLKAENRRQREEGTSVDHALACAPGQQRDRADPVQGGHQVDVARGGVAVEVTILVPKGKVAKTKECWKRPLPGPV